MRRRAAFSPGLLLIEAVLAAIVVAFGIALVTQSLSSQLRAMRALEDRETLLLLAQRKLLELEALAASGSSVPEDHAGAFEPPFEAYEWTITAAAREDLLDADGEPVAVEVQLAVARGRGSSAGTGHLVLWPASWVPEAWF